MMRRLLSLALLVLLGSPVACEKGSAHEAPAVTGANRAHAGEAIVFLGDSRPPARRLEGALIERFTADTGIRVTSIPKPDDSTAALFTYRRALSDRPEAVDVLLIDTIWPPSLAGDLADLGTTLGPDSDRYWGPAIENDRIAGRLVAIPHTLDFGVLYYRRDLLAAHGFDRPPRTWEELDRMAATIQEGERRRDPGFYGFLWSGMPGESLTCTAIEWQVSHGGAPILDPQTGAVAVDTPAAITAFRRAASWPGRISPPGTTRYREADAVEGFRSGRAAFMRGWTTEFPMLLTKETPIRDHIGIAPLPQAERVASTLGGWHLAVSARSRQPEAARMFVRYMIQPEVLTWLASRHVIVPAILEMHDDPALRAAHPFLREVRAVVPHAVARPSEALGESYPAVSQLYAETVNAILRGSDPAFGCASMQQALISWIGVERPRRPNTRREPPAGGSR